jgi:hypothetical protein
MSHGNLSIIQYFFHINIEECLYHKKKRKKKKEKKKRKEIRNVFTKQMLIDRLDETDDERLQGGDDQ